MGFVFCSGSKTLFVKDCAPSRKASQLHGRATRFMPPGNSYLELDALSSLSSQSSQCVLIKTPGLPVCTRACTLCSFEGGAVCSCRLSAITPKWSKICAHPCSSRGLMHPPGCGESWTGALHSCVQSWCLGGQDVVRSQLLLEPGTTQQLWTLWPYFPPLPGTCMSYSCFGCWAKSFVYLCESWWTETLTNLKNIFSQFWF